MKNRSNFDAGTEMAPNRLPTRFWRQFWRDLDTFLVDRGDFFMEIVEVFDELHAQGSGNSWDQEIDTFSLQLHSFVFLLGSRPKVLRPHWTRILIQFRGNCIDFRNVSFIILGNAPRKTLEIAV